MNLLLVTAGVLCGITTLIHLFAGQATVVVPMRRADFDRVANDTMLAAWHMVSIYLAASAVWLLALGLGAVSPAHPGVRVPTLWLATTFVASAAVFVVLNLRSPTWRGFFVDLPQWILLAPIGGLAAAGAW